MPGVDHGFLPALWAEQRERAQLRLPEHLQSGVRAAAGAEHPLPLFNHFRRLLPMAPGGRSGKTAAHAYPAEPGWDSRTSWQEVRGLHHASSVGHRMTNLCPARMIASIRAAEG